MSSIWGTNIKISIFGESHGRAIGVSIHNLPSGKKLDIEKIYEFMAKRQPGKDEFSTPRKEEDKPEIISGFCNGFTTGTPLTALIYNSNIRSNDYEKTKNIARPSHADYSGFLRYDGYNDIYGGGHFSARLTAPLVFAGAVAIQFLEDKDIFIGSHIRSIENIVDSNFDYTSINKKLLVELGRKEFPVINEDRAKEMKNAILNAKKENDSVGGIIECAVVGMKGGIGSPIFDGIENKLASIIFGIPAIKGLQFGKGFELSRLRGSRANDEMYIEDGQVKTYSNNNGGILGGISNGMPIVFNVAIKPTPSIGKEQRSINYLSKTNEKILIEGRHDPCIVKRAIPCIEAATGIAIFDLLIGENKWI